MKQLITLSAAGLLAFAAQAQHAGHPQSSNVLTPVGAQIQPSTPFTAPVSHLAAKGATATAFVTDTFSSASFTTGGANGYIWTTSGNTGTLAWKVATAGSSYHGAINSTTKAGGFMFYDAFNNGAAVPNTNPQYGFLVSPTFNTVGHAYVGVRFQNYHRHLADTTFVDVSTNNFATFSRYPVYVNNTLAGNGQTDNPTIVTIATPAASSQSSVKFRFTYAGGYTGAGTNGSGGTYGWAIDDFQLLDLDQVDLSVSKSVGAIPLHNANGYTSFGSIPRVFVDTVFTYTNLYNYGGTAQSSVNVTSTTYFNGTSVKNLTKTFGVVPVNANDSAADFRNVASNGYRPTASGTLTHVFAVNQTNDGTTSNNVDTVAQIISDSVWYMYRPNTAITGGYYIQNGTGTTPTGFYSGTLYEVGQGKTDTLTSVDIAFHPITNAGTQVRAEIYKLDETDPNNPFWTQVSSSVTRTITAADIPASGAIIWTKFMSNVGTATTKQYTVLNEGEYGIVIHGLNVPATSSIVVYNGKGPANLVGRFGLSDTSGTTFGTRVTYNEQVPLMRLNFSTNAKCILDPNNAVCKPVAPGSVGNTANAAYELNAFPNPAYSDLTVSFKLPTAQEATVRLMNTMGQTVMSQTTGKLNAGQKGSAHFNTAQLAAGMYYYSVEAAGSRATGRVMIAR